MTEITFYHASSSYDCAESPIKCAKDEFSDRGFFIFLLFEAPPQILFIQSYNLSSESSSDVVTAMFICNRTGEVFRVCSENNYNNLNKIIIIIFFNYFEPFNISIFL